MVKLGGVEERMCDGGYENEVHGEDEDHAHEAIHIHRAIVQSDLMNPNRFDCVVEGEGRFWTVPRMNNCITPLLF